MAPLAAHAQPRETDKRLEDLIPDSAIENPEAWAGQTPAAQQGEQPAPELDPSSPLAPLPEMRLAWPDATALPAVQPLAPEPDIQLAEDRAEAELAALGVAPDQAAPRILDAVVHKVARQVELALPAKAEFPGRATFEDRFAALSTLKKLDDKDANLAQVSRRARADRELLQQMLRVYGYYDAEVYQSLSGLEPGAEGAPPADMAKLVVRFDVIPGPRYAYGKIELGDLAATGPDFAALRKAFGLVEGQPIDSDEIVQERTDLATELGETGYAFAQVGDPDLLIDHARRQGDLTVPVATGGKYRFGEVISALPKFLSSKHLQTIARFDPGDTYKASLVTDLRRAILATGLVSSVTVTPRETAAPAPAEPGAVALDVAMTKAPLRTIAGLAGYSTGEGLRIEASWEHRNLFPPEGLLRVRGVAGTREQLAGVTFRRNNFTGRDKVLSVDLFAQTLDRDGFNARTVSLIGSFERQTTLIYQKDLVYAFGLEAVASGEREDGVGGTGPRKTYYIAALPGRIGIDHSDDLLDPTRGFRAAVRVSPELSLQGGVRSTYVKAQLDASYYRPVGDRIVLAARGRLGTIAGAPIAAIAPSRRFYAGGGGSVRGYGYQQIGPRNAADEPSGGRSLSELSFEARVRTGFFGGALSVVPFIDGGAVDETSTPSFTKDLRFGAGIGVRYKTNFGPLRVDVGTPLNPGPKDSKIAVYVALGQAF